MHSFNPNLLGVYYVLRGWENFSVKRQTANILCFEGNIHFLFHGLSSFFPFTSTFSSSPSSSCSFSCCYVFSYFFFATLWKNEVFLAHWSYMCHLLNPVLVLGLQWWVMLIKSPFLQSSHKLHLTKTNSRRIQATIIFNSICQLGDSKEDHLGLRPKGSWRLQRIMKWLTVLSY